MKVFCSNKKKYLPYIIFIIVTLLYCLPIFKNITYWGQMDWDQFTFWNAVPRESFLRYHQLPLWNHYSNGGNVMAALPHASFFSPLFVFILLFGPVAGLKVLWAMSVYIGMLGTFHIMRYFKTDVFSQYFAPLVFMLNSLFALHLSEGHVEWMSMSLLPWFLLFSLKSVSEKKYLLFAAMFISMMLLGGSVYIYAITGFFITVYFIFLCIKEKKVCYINTLMLILAAAFLLSSIKIIPMLEFITERPRRIESQEGLNLALLPTVFLSHRQNTLYQNSKWLATGHTYKLGNQEIDYGWHEYGAYVGVLPLLLAFFGAAAFFRIHWPLVFSGLACLWIALGSGAPFNLWALVHTFPIYDSLHVPTRFLTGLMLPLSVFSALGLSKIRELAGSLVRYRVLASLVCAVVFFDILSVNYPLLDSTFVISPVYLEPAPAFRQRYRDFNLFPGQSRSSMYPVLLSNSGILNAYEVLNVKKGQTKTVDDSGYRGEAYLLNEGSSATITYFSPNKVVVDIETGGPDILVLNQNYYRGWRARGRQGKKVFAHDGLIAVAVGPQDTRILFRYFPNSFIIGVSKTLITLFFGVVMWIIAGIIKWSPRRHE